MAMPTRSTPRPARRPPPAPSTKPKHSPPPPKQRAGRMASAGVIMDAATQLFLRNGYLGTSIDDIATLAHVSKQTVYTHFQDKEQLFAELIRANTERADDFVQALASVLHDTDDVERDLRLLARRYISSVIQTPVLQLRRLVIGESGRFPELARAYYERVPRQVIAALATQLEALMRRGLLRLHDPVLAANHLAWLILGMPLDEAMFGTDGPKHSAAELEHLADAAVDAFLAAYCPYQGPCAGTR
jgi:TetR/AcrR family transcriptional repressor of mexJK operon